MFFDGFGDLGRTLIVGVLAYLILVGTLRATGKRTLAKMNAFDFVVTVALGSTLATILLSSEVALAEGALAFVLLAGLQFLVAFGTVHFPPLRRLAKSEPRLLFADGRPRQAAMADERVTADEVAAAIRKAGIGDVGLVSAVVLETDGSFSVIASERAGDRSALEAVK